MTTARVTVAIHLARVAPWTLLAVRRPPCPGGSALAVTRANSGIGEGIARAMAAAGAAVPGSGA